MHNDESHLLIMQKIPKFIDIVENFIGIVVPVGAINAFKNESIYEFTFKIHPFPRDIRRFTVSFVTSFLLIFLMFTSCCF